MNENDTAERVMRVRIVAWPPLDEIDEYDIRRRFRIGQIYELPVHFAATLIILGYAENSSGRVQEREPDRAEAADVPPHRRRTDP